MKPDLRKLAIAVAVVTLIGACVEISFPTPEQSTPRLGAQSPTLSPPTASPSPAPTAPASSTPSPTAQPTTQPTVRPTAPPTATPTATPPMSDSVACTDRAHKIFGERWRETFRWYFQESSTPDGLDPAEVLEVLKRSVTNITDARNDCGLPDEVGAKSIYVAETDTKPDINSRARCSGSDGRNVVGFGKLPENMLGLTCLRFFAQSIVEADVLFNSEIDWALSVEECVSTELLEAVATHEFGHVFGLDHVSERKHGELTMSPFSNGPCDAEEISLGLGDILGLEELY